MHRGRPGEDTARRWPSASQDERPHQKLTLLDLGLGLPASRMVRGPPFHGALLCSPSGLIQMVKDRLGESLCPSTKEQERGRRSIHAEICGKRYFHIKTHRYILGHGWPYKQRHCP